MKIIIHVNNLSGHWPYQQGFANVLRYAGHEVHYWFSFDPNAPALFDLFSRVQPDLFYSQTYELTPGMIRLLKQHPQCKVILFASANGDAVKEVGPEYPIVRVTNKEKKLVAQLKEETGQPQLVFIHHHPNRVAFTLGGWGSMGIAYAGIANAADLFTFFNGTERENLECDIAYVGGYWKYKNLNIDKFILPLCALDRNPRLRVKIGGNQGWQGVVPQYVGYMQDATMNDLFASAKVCPNSHEPHSNVYGTDVVERPWKCISAGGFCVSDHVESLVKDFCPNGEIPTAKTPKEYAEMVDYWLINDDKREEKRQTQFDRVIAEHTYFNRMEYLFAVLNMPEEARNINNWYKIFKKERNIICQEVSN